MQKAATKYSLPFLLIMILGVSYFASRITQAEEQIKIKIDYVAEYNKITKPPDYDPNQNAAPHYRRAFETLVDIADDIQAIRKIWPGDMNDTEINSLKNWLALNKEPIPSLKAAAQKPYYWVEHNIENNYLIAIAMPELRKLRTAVYLLGLRARLIASKGQIRPALQDVIDTCKMGAHLKGPKTLVEQLAGISIRTLAAQDAFQILDKTHPSPNLLQDFQNQLEMLSARHTHTIDFTFDKLMVYDNIQRMFTDDGKGGGHVYGTRASENTEHLESLWGWEITPEKNESFKRLERQQTTELADKLYLYFADIAKKTPAQLHSQGLDPVESLEQMTKDDPLLHTLAPAFNRAAELSYRAKATTDALITTLSLLRHKADKACFPDSLKQLLKTGYLKELSIDPYSDGPLVYRRIDDNFTLYSLGADFDDDGGTPSKWGEGEGCGDQVFWPVERY